MIPRLHFLAFGLAAVVVPGIGVSKGCAAELPQLDLAREYQLALPAVKKLEAELTTTRKRLERAPRSSRGH